MAAQSALNAMTSVFRVSIVSDTTQTQYASLVVPASYFLAFWVVALTPLDVANTLDGGKQGYSVLTVLVSGGRERLRERRRGRG